MVTAFLSDVYHPLPMYLVDVDVSIKFSSSAFLFFKYLHPIFRAFKVCELYGMCIVIKKQES